MPKDEQNIANEDVKKELDYQEAMKVTIQFDVTGGLQLLAGVLGDKTDKEYLDTVASYEFEVINGREDEDEPLFEQALKYNPEGYKKYRDQTGTERNIYKVIDKKAFDKYRSYVIKGADKLDEFIDKNVVVNDEYGKKAKEFMTTISTNRMRRSAKDGADAYLQYKHLLAGGNASMYAGLNSSLADNKLQKNIEKWQHKLPVHQLVIDGGKQLQTMSDYWMEKEKNNGVLSPERELEYRQKLYDQTVSMSALYDKMVDTLEDKQANDEIDADKLFGNQAFHFHPRSKRGTASYKCGLKAMKIGLENGWDIEDTARLAAFYQLVYKEESKLICNGALEYDNFEMYDKPKYTSPEHERYMDRLKSAWEIVEETKLEGPADRNGLLRNIDNLVKEGLEKGYLDKTSGAVSYYQQTVKQAVVRDNLVLSGAAPAFCEKNNIKTGEGRRMEIVFANMNAARKGSESIEHKNMRVALEELQTFLKENPKMDPKTVSKEELLEYNTKYMEKLAAVKKTAEKYKDIHPHPKTEAGKTRLQGADEASMLVGIEIDNAMNQLKKQGLCAKEDNMEIFQIKNTGLNKGYKEVIKEQANTINEFVSNLKAVDGWTSSTNFKNLKNGLNELKAFTDKLNNSNKHVAKGDMDKFNELVTKVGKLANTYLDNKKDINSDYARSRVKAVKKIKEGLDFIGKATPQIENLIDKKLFGDKYKLYDSLDITSAKDGAHAFWGEKYKDPAMRSKGQGDYSMPRTAGISVSVFALANTGKYSFEDIMDPTKLVKEKQEMFDKVATAMQNPTPESQKWIAETIYNGQKTTENMIDEQAKLVDFSKVDISTDRRFCQMLKMSHVQFDAWQEMAHCKDEIMELVKKDHPELKNYGDYREWWSGRHGFLGQINEGIVKKRQHLVDAVATNDFGYAATILQEDITEKLLMNDLTVIQKEKKDAPFSEWVSHDVSQESYLKTNLAGTQVAQQASFLNNNPEVARQLAAKIADGSLSKNVTASVDMEKFTVTVSGFPSVDDLKKTAQAEQFLKKTDKALGRLKNGQYKNKESFIEDCACAMIGQMYRSNGGKLPRGKDGNSMSLEDYKDMQVNSKQFVDSLRSPENPKNFISPKKVVDMANNQKKIQGMAKDLAAQKNKTVNMNNPQKNVNKEVEKQVGAIGK